MNKFKITLISIFILLCIVIACNQPSEMTIKKTTLYNNNPQNEFQYTVIVIDSCEYIMWRGANGYLQITHKGNCKNHKK